MSLLSAGATVKVSSVLGKNSKLYGKQHLTDGREETCWNSEQGRPQTIVCGLANAAARVEQIVLTFQGGFAAKTCEVWMGGDELKLRTTLYPADSNAEQVFKLEGDEAGPTTAIKLVMDSYDFFGRITIYKLDILGASLQ